VSSGYAGAIDLVIFDNDGVVVDSELLANRVLSDLLTECGHPTSLEECIREYMGGTLAGVRSSVRRQWGDELPDAFDDLYHDRLFDAFSTDLRPVRGIEQVLSELDLPYCLASSGTFERINRSLSVTGLAEYFSGRIFSAEQVANGKPAPDLFLHVARAAGMAVLGYTALTPADRLRDAEVTFDEMEQLPGLIREFA
jgi:beta-phosphoglucomutase-like phosphatase (HAD superfamily)